MWATHLTVRIGLITRESKALEIDHSPFHSAPDSSAFSDQTCSFYKGMPVSSKCAI